MQIRLVILMTTVLCAAAVALAQQPETAWRASDLFYCVLNTTRSGP